MYINNEYNVEMTITIYMYTDLYILYELCKTLKSAFLASWIYL